MAIQTATQDDPQAIPLFTDPDNQRKMAENVLTQLGLHPDQMGARSLLDEHLTGPTAHPDVKDLIAPVKPIPTGSSAPVADTTASASTPSIPGPGVSQKPLFGTGNTPASNTHDQTLIDQAELNRKIATGSGISQIKNPILRTLAHVGEVAETGLFPSFAAVTPGTLLHHNIDLGNQEKMVNSDIENEQKEANTAHTSAATNDLENKPDKDPSELAVWLKQHPNEDISKYWVEKAASGGGKLTPDEQLLKSLTTPIADGGEGLSVEDAYKKMATLKATTKPPTAAGNEQALETLLAKAIPDGKMNPQLMSNPMALGKFIADSPDLTPEEKAQLQSHFVFKTSPASQAGVAATRAGSILHSRENSVIDTQTGHLALVDAATVNANPGRYIPASQGSTALTRESVFSDMHFNLNSVRDAYANLQHGFDTKSRAQIALMLRSPDPHSAMDAFLKSSVASTLTPDQMDLVTALASMNENGMMMRSIQGIGAGSDQVRAAIGQLIPGAGTPNKDYAKRQLDLLEGTINRLETGVAKTGVHQAEQPPISKTGEHDQKFQYHDPASNQTFTFKTQKQLDDFKKEAGIH